MLLTLPSIAANVNCNGKPFHCVNSTHFMICVDLGSGVSSTIDDFVIPCPPTTVCQGTNRFECEFPAITTTTATSVAPLVASVSETMVTVTTPIYEVTTSIPFEEYYNKSTLSTTTLSEDVLITHQTIATEPTVTESTIQRITDRTQNIEVSDESNSTLSETIADVVQNDFTTPLPDYTSANVTEPISDATENVNVTITVSETSSVLSETMPSLKAIHNDLTTLTPLLDNTSTSAADLIPNATVYLIDIIPEYETDSSIDDTILSLTDNGQNEPTLYASTGSALPILADTTTASILTEVTETALGESILSDTNPSVDITLPELTIFTPLPDNIRRANATVLNLDATESSNVLPDFKINSISTDSISSATDVSQNEPLFTSDSSTMIISTADTITESILSQMTETTPSASTFKKTFPIVDFIQNEVTTITPLPDNRSVNTTDLIPNSTENVRVVIPESKKIPISIKTTSSLDVVQNYLATLLPNNLSANATDLIADVTDNLNETMFESETNPPLNETIPVKTELVKNHAPLDTLGSNSLSINIADTVTESILEVKEITPSVYINVVKNYVTNLNTSSNTALPDKIVDIVPESVITGMTQRMPLADIIQDDHTTLVIPSKTVMPSNITTEPTVSDVTANINIASTESIYKSSTKTIPIEIVDFVKFHPTEPVSSSTAYNTNVVEAESNSNLTLRRNLTGGNENIVQNDIPLLNTQHTITLPNTSEPFSNDNVLNTLINEINKANATDNQYSFEIDRNRKIIVFLTPSAEGSQTIPTITDSSNNNVETTPNSNVETTISAQRVRSITVGTNTKNIENNQESNQIDKTTVLNEEVLTTGTTVSVTAPTPTLVVVRNENLFASSLVSFTDSDIPVPHPTTKLTFTPTTDTLTVNESPFLTTNQESNIPGVRTLGGKRNDIVLPLTTLEHNDTSKSFNVNASEWLVPKHADTTDNSNYLPLLHLFPNTTKDDDIEERPPLTDYNLQQSTNSPVDITVISEFKATGQTTMATTFTVAETSEGIFLETLPIALSFENATVKDDLNRAKDNALNDKNAEHNTNTSSLDSNVTSNDEPKLPEINSKLTNTDNFVPVYPITEVILTEVETNPKNIQSFKSKLDNVKALTQSTMSSLLLDNIQSEILSVSDIIHAIATSTSVVVDPGLNINSTITKNTKEGEETLNPKIFAPELINSSFQTELPVENSAKTKAVTKTPAMLTETSVTNIIGVGNSVTSVTKSSPMDEGDFTVSTADANVLMWSNDKTVIIDTEAKEENNLLINLLLNSPVKQITKVTTNEISLDSIHIQKDTKNNTSTNKIFSGDSSTHVNDDVLSVGLAQQELYTESIIKHTETNLQTPLSNNNFSVTVISPSAIIPDIQKGLTQVTSENHTHTLDITSQIKESTGFEKFHESPVDSIRIRPPYQDITTDKKINSIPLTDFMEPPQQAPTENYYRENTSETNQITVLEQASIDNSKTNPNQDVLITKSMPIRTVGLKEVKGINTLNTVINIENEAPVLKENVKLPKQAQNTETNNFSTFDQHIEVSKPSQNTITVEPQIYQGTSTESQPEITMIPLVTIVQDIATEKLNKDFSDTTTAVPITEALKTTVITKPYIEITSQLITEQSEYPMIERTSTEPQGKKPMISDSTTQTLSRPNMGRVVSIPELQAQYATSSSIIDESPGIGVKPINELTTRTWSQVTRASEITDETFSKPNLVKVVSHPRVEPINVLKNNVVSQTTVQLPTLETRFINISKEVVTQSNRQEVTPNALNTNTDADIVILDFVKTNVPVLEENILLTSTHSGISVLQKPPRKEKNEQNEKLEWSESVEGSEAESNEGVNNVTTAIRDSTHDTSKSSKTSTGQVNEQSVHENIDLTGTPKTWDSRLPLKTNKMSLNSTIQIATKKMDENSNSGYQTIINIELLSTNAKSTEYVAPSKVARGGSTDPNEKSTKNESTINASANMKNSTTRYSPKTKSQFANTHNESVPAFESTANSFVCKQNSRGRISDNKDCRKFYICIGKPEPIEGLCPNNTVFSELRKQCTKNLSHCVRNNQFHCTSEGRFSDYLNDNTYYICVKNNIGTFIRFKLQCQSDYHLNKTSVRCALNTEASQSTSQQSKSDISKNNSDQSAFSGKSEKLVVESIKKIECKKEGRFPDANDCRKYYVCVRRGRSQYRRKSKKCDSDELFHKDKKKCVDADSYECS